MYILYMFDRIDMREEDYGAYIHLVLNIDIWNDQNCSAKPESDISTRQAV